MKKEEKISSESRFRFGMVFGNDNLMLECIENIPYLTQYTINICVDRGAKLFEEIGFDCLKIVENCCQMFKL